MTETSTPYLAGLAGLSGREADDYRRAHTAELADELMPDAQAARQDLRDALTALREAVARWDRARQQFTPLVQARRWADMSPNDLPDNPAGHVDRIAAGVLDTFDRQPYKTVPAPWQAVPDGDLTWPVDDQGQAHAGGAARNLSALRAGRESFRTGQ